MGPASGKWHVIYGVPVPLIYLEKKERADDRFNFFSKNIFKWVLSVAVPENIPVIVVSDADCHAGGSGFESRRGYGCLKLMVSLRHWGTLNSRGAASLLVKLGEREERWEAPDQSQSVHTENWGGTEPNRTQSYGERQA
ncbi:hypothetical protein TNCV_169791 [Trichonephila clavipes]|nr:hypothetical protein TNCV_169791 [Trichonephila clavipes]